MFTQLVNYCQYVLENSFLPELVALMSQHREDHRKAF